MRTKLLIRISLASISPIMLIYLLFIHADMPNSRPNGFNRAFYPIPLFYEYDNMQLPADVQYIVPTYHSKTLYFSTRDASKLYRYALGSRKFDKIELESMNSLKEAIGPHFHGYVSHDSLYTVLPKKIRLSIQVAIKGHQHLQTNPFPRHLYAVPYTDNQYIVQHVANNKKMFCHWHERTEHLQCDTSRLLVKTRNIDEDGQLFFDQVSLRYFYMHYYQNRVLHFDTSLHDIKAIKTIDTISNSLKGKKDGPLLVINQRATVYRGLLLLASNLKAENENRKDYLTHIPVDVYTIDNGLYSGSFYLPLSNGTLIKSFAVLKDMLYVLYHSNELKIFDIDPSGLVAYYQ